MDSKTMDVEEMRKKYLPIGRRQAYELCNSKGFPAFRIGRKVLVNREGLETWMKEQEERRNDD